MRTTLTIDDDIATVLRDEADHSRRSFKSVVNEVLRRGLAVGAKPPARREPFQVNARHLGRAPGVDPLKLNQLADELDVDRFIEKARRDLAGS